MGKYKKVYIEINNVCNLKCNFCPETKRQAGLMGLKEFSHVITEIKPFTEYVYFHIMGEPLLHPHLDKFLLICNENGLKVNITTNGTLLNEKKELLFNAPALRKVSISLHSFEANEKAGSLRHYLEQAVNFAVEASGNGIICEFRLWNFDAAEMKGSNTLNMDISSFLEQALALDFSIEEAMAENSNIKLKNYIYLQKAEKFQWPDIKREHIRERVFCYGLRDQFGILVDGTVVPCCLDSEGSIPLGNVFKQPLSEILGSQRARRMYDGFTARTASEELCRKCGYAERHRRS